MTPESTLPKCQKCAAQASRLDARFCEYCGAEFPRPAAQPAVPSGAGGASLNLEARFLALQEHPDRVRLMAFSPEDAGKAGPLAIGFMVLFMFAWVGIGGVITIGFGAVGPGPMVLFPIALVSFGVIAMLAAARRYHRFLSAPIIPQPALVVDERVQVSGGGKNSSARTNYHTTLEFPDGQRTEHETIAAAAVQACPGDVGVAYLRDRKLVHFERIPV